MFSRVKIISTLFLALTAFSTQATIIINNKTTVPVFEKNVGEKIYELTGKARGTTTKHSVAVVDFAPEAKTIPHYHPEGVEESYYVLSGEGTAIIGDEKAVIKTGDLLIIPQKVLHQVINNSKTHELKLLVTVAEAWTPECMILPAK